MIRSQIYRWAPAVGAVLLGLALPLAAQDEYSRARIVRLSFVDGSVSVLRAGSADWAGASINTPMQEGFQLSTDKNSFAEVQFENGSTARVGELTLLKFDQLGLTETGESLNKMTLDRGYGTFEMAPDKIAVFEVRSGDATLKPRGKAEFRVDVVEGRMRVEVLKGALDIESPEINTTVARGNILEVSPGGTQAYVLSAGISRDDWDEWVEQRDQAIAAATPPAGVTPGAPGYGWSDLNQYGTWSYLDGYGYGWVPDVTGPWSPFTAGQWCWYPSFGYTWISYEPWGWLPYHYGGWAYTGLFGWAWFPGVSWGWMPATVNWHQGTNWVGWTPSGPVLGRTGLGAGKLPPPAKGCPGAAGCMNAVSVETFQKGGPLQPRQFLKVAANDGAAVASPTIQPGRLALLPGAPARMSSAQMALVGRAPSFAPARAPIVVSPSSSAREFSRRAPDFTLAAPPAQARGSSHVFWGGPSSGGGAPSVQAGGLSGGSHVAGGSSHGGMIGGSVGASRGGGGMVEGSHASASAPSASSGSHGGGGASSAPHH